MHQHAYLIGHFSRLLQTPLTSLHSRREEGKPSSIGGRSQALSRIMRDSYYSQTVATLTTGVFLVGFALQFHASNLMIGLLSAIPLLAQLLQVPGVYLVERFQARRQITIIATLLSRLCLIPMMAAPLMPTAEGSLSLLFIGFAFQTGFAAVAACAWNSWLRDMVPTTEMGRFFSHKLMLNTLVTLVLTLLGGYFIDQWSKQFPEQALFGYSLLFLTALLLGLLGIRPLTRIPEPRLKKPPVSTDKTASRSFIQTLLEPLRDSNFLSLVRFMAMWNFAINLATPFFTVYMLTLLDYPVVTVTLMTMLSQISNLLFLKLWGRLADRFSNKSIIRVCAPLFVFCILGWTFTTLPEPHAFTMPLVVVLHVLLGVATAGVTLGNGNIAMKLAPEGKATGYLATNSMLASLAAGIAPILGGLFADFFARQELSVVLNWQAPGAFFAIRTLDLQHWDFFFGVAFVLGLLSLSRLGKVAESGDVRKQVVIREFVIEVRRSVGSLPARRGFRLLGSTSRMLWRSVFGQGSLLRDDNH